MLAGTLTVARREWTEAFGRPFAWAVVALFLAGYALVTLWYDDLLLSGVSSLRSSLGWLSTGLVLLAPATTMRAFAEDRRTGTWQVLHALPLTPTAVVAGKWLGALGVCGAAVAATAPWPLALAWVGDPDPGPVVCGYLGVALAAGALTAVGLAASALTDSPVLAYLLGVAVCGGPALAGRALILVPGPLVPLVEASSVVARVDELARGVLVPGALAWFAAVTAVGLRIAVHRLELRRLA